MKEHEEVSRKPIMFALFIVSILFLLLMRVLFLFIDEEEVQLNYDAKRLCIEHYSAFRDKFVCESENELECWKDLVLEHQENNEPFLKK